MTSIPDVITAFTRRQAPGPGGIKALARALGVKHQTFYSWRRVPAERVIDIERLTGISRHRLRPDLYPRGRRK